MSCRYKILSIVAITILVSIFVWILVNMIGDIPPYDDWAGNHEEDLKKIPQVFEFYRHYEKDYDILIYPDSGRFYQLGFQALKDDQRAFLKVIYFNAQPYSVSYSCDEGEKHTDLLRIKNADASQIIDCFDKDVNSKIELQDESESKENTFTTTSSVSIDPPSGLSQDERKQLQIQKILDSCNSTGIQPSMGYRYSNDTHIITNTSCEWQTLED